MSWKRRILELTLAGGVLGSVSGCGSFFGCNANPDPCCAMPDSQACRDYRDRDLSMSQPVDMSVGDLERPRD